MVAYSFKGGFVRPIQLKSKRQTIRQPRKRHARTGEPVQLYYAQRTRSCYLIGTGLVAGVHDVRLDFAADVVELDSAIVHSTREALDGFALRDGFGPFPHQPVQPSAWKLMKRWWAHTHGDVPVFSGVLIDWDDSFAPAEARAA